MTTKEERLDILDKLAKGKLSTAEAAAMLSMDESAPEPTIKIEEEVVAADDTPVAKAAPDATHHDHKSNGKRPKWMRIQVNDLSTGQRRVSVNIPLGLMKFGLKVGRRFAPELEDFDVEELTHAIAGMESGLLVDVQDEKDGEHVRIFVE